MKNISMLINTADKRSHINPEIYGHFSEHLGRCIYNGMYVGENSEIPNINGVRKVWFCNECENRREIE